ncbi:Clp protease N-terminal domain-containing protein [Yinghuangia soli]|uniref:Clp R domain-containing protein n=1 Tax=Yinghuangia soli TaxID=2908204 RepID=A0AA41U3B8_9ACTN|nr:Clp protease N-terminal domain-containing protein [Yinghuangia soli]MCF2531631.1 hypothetical protein [Yinghuangia soli]
MFERFTDDARQAVVAAREEARRLEQATIAPEHLVLGVLGVTGDPVVRTLADAGIDLPTARRAVERADGVDAAALESIGIDFAEVRRKVEAEFGSGALSGAGRRGGSRTGIIRFDRDAKKALAQSLRAALALEHRIIAPGHLLLGVVRAGEGALPVMFAEQGVTPAGLADTVTRTMTAPS